MQIDIDIVYRKCSLKHFVEDNTQIMPIILQSLLSIFLLD